MSEIEFTDELALALERLYNSPDVRAQRAAMIAMLDVRKGSHILDIGSGPGFLCEALADATGPEGHVLGIDVSADLIARCSARNNPPWLSYALGDATQLSMEDNGFDMAVCAQVAEYIPEYTKVLSEVFRILKPGGTAMIVATDWDTVAWHSDQPDRMARVMQAWEAHCAHVNLPRTLAHSLQAAGFEEVQVGMHPIINMRYDADTYSFGISGLICDFVTNSDQIPQAEAEAWLAELADLNEAGRYYFASTRMIFTASKPG